MKSITLFFSVLIFNSLFSQVPKLQKASDFAQDKIDRDDIPESPFQPLKYVNPFVGTGGHGHTLPNHEGDVRSIHVQVGLPGFSCSNSSAVWNLQFDVLKKNKSRNIFSKITHGRV